MADVKKLADGTVKDAEKALPDLSDAELNELREAEAKGKGRVTLLDAIDSERLSRESEADEPETEPRDAAEVKAYEQGRHARKNGIGKAESPHGKGDLRDAWVEGWKFQDSL